MKKDNDILKPALILFGIAIVTSSLLAVTNHFTKPIVEARAKEEQIAALQVVMPDAKSFSDPKTITIGDDDESPLDAGEYTYYEAYDDAGEKIGVVATGSARGYGDLVEFTAGVDGEGLITGIKQLKLNETPGIGMRAADETFQKQFIGKTGPLLMNGGDGTNEVDALSGATVTSNAVNSALNQVLNIANVSYDGQLFAPSAPSSGSEKLTAVMPDAPKFSERMLLKAEEGQVENAPAGDYHYYLAQDDAGETIGVVVVSSGEGYVGEVKVMTGFKADLSITGLSPLDHNETPGYGAAIDDEAEQTKFVGLTTPLELKANYDGISNATSTSKALVTAVNSGASIADLILNQGAEGTPDPESDTPEGGAAFKFFAEPEDLEAVATGLAIGDPQAIDVSSFETRELSASSYLFYPLKDDADETKAVAVVTEQKGFAGDLVMVTSVDAEGKTLASDFITMNESDGYGKDADDAEWLKRLSGLTGPVELGTSFDGISGATKTSNAIATSVNEALQVADVLFKQDGLAAATKADPNAEVPAEPTPEVTPPATTPVPDDQSGATPLDPDSWSGPTPEDADGQSQWPDAEGGATADDDQTTEESEAPDTTENVRDVKPEDEEGVKTALNEMLGIDTTDLTASTVTVEAGAVGEVPADTYIYYALADEKLALITWSANGFNGSIEVLSIMNPDQTIHSVKVLSHQETEGVGSKIEKPEYLAQFEGLSDASADTISHATVSSKAMNEAVKYAFELAAHIKGGQA